MFSTGNVLITAAHLILPHQYLILVLTDEAAVSGDSGVVYEDVHASQA
jgi:hypothetical protein